MTSNGRIHPTVPLAMYCRRSVSREMSVRYDAAITLRDPQWDWGWCMPRDLRPARFHNFRRQYSGFRRDTDALVQWYGIWMYRLRKLGQWTLEQHRSRADLIEVFKMCTGLSTLEFDSLFEVSNNSHIRGHSLKLAKHRCRLDPRKYFLQKESFTEGILLVSKLSTVQVWTVSKVLWQEQEMQRWVSSWIIPFSPMVFCLLVKSVKNGLLRSSNLMGETHQVNNQVKTGTVIIGKLAVINWGRVRTEP